MMIARQLRPHDLESCLAVRPVRIGQELVGYQRALSAWKTLVQSDACKSVVIETPEPVLGYHILGFGALVFVSSEFARDTAMNPKPGLNGRIICSIDRGQSVLLTETQLRYQNTYGGLNVVILFTDWRRGISLTPEHIAEIKLHLAKSGVERLSGYRLEKILLEAIDAVDREYIESTGVYRMIRDFAESHSKNPTRKWEQSCGLFGINKASAQSVVGSVATFVFQYTPPILGFRRPDQQLLAAALEGLTDHELACHLNLKMETIKKRWASVYAQVSEILPDLLPESADEIDRQTRGPQKRHHVLAYLRNHPEELRPFIRQSASLAR